MSMLSIKQLQTRISNVTADCKAKDKTIKGLRFQIKEYELRESEMENAERNQLYLQIDHLHHSLIEQSQIVAMYQQWFTRNQYWTQIHNNMMKYNPALGNYEHEGADEPIVIPEPEQWERVKGVPSLSTVAELEDEV